MLWDMESLESMYPNECREIRQDERQKIIQYLQNNIKTLLLNGLGDIKLSTELYEDKDATKN